MDGNFSEGSYYIHVEVLGGRGGLCFHCGWKFLRGEEGMFSLVKFREG